MNVSYLWFPLILQDACRTPQMTCCTANHRNVVTGTSGRGEKVADFQVPIGWAVRETVWLPIKLQHN